MPAPAIRCGTFCLELAARLRRTYVKVTGWHNRESTMKRSVWALGLLLFALAASSPARADYAVVQLDNGWCKIWWDSSATPWGVGWSKIAIGLPDWLSASAALNTARSQGVCR